MPQHAPSLIDILVHTPLWVWALFAFVLYIGWQRTRDRVVPLWRLLLLPGVLAIVSVSGWFGAGSDGLPAIGAGVVLGAGIGWLLERPGATRRLSDNRVWLRGDWWSLLQIALILALRYATAIVPIADPALAGNGGWHLTTLFLSSGLTALFVGRAAARLRTYFTSSPAVA